MKLPVKEAYEAYRSRDTSYDGVLFVGIKSTGIYCRPICPARRASAKNCDFFESAAEAEAAGSASSATRNGLPFQQAF